jgi:hypothetical protein
MKRLPFVAPLVLVALSSACSSGGKDESGDTTGIVPTSGAYVITLSDELGGDCPAHDPPPDTDTAAAEEIRWTVDVSDDNASFSLSDPAGTYACTLEGAAYSCLVLDELHDNTADGVDAIAEFKVENAGSWTTEAQIDGALTSSLSCEGTQCDQLPGAEYCTSTQGYTGTLDPG